MGNSCISVYICMTKYFKNTSYAQLALFEGNNPYVQLKRSFLANFTSPERILFEIYHKQDRT